MFLGILFALAACFIWGWIFVIPQFMIGFSSIEIALGRYAVYGVLSLLIFCKARLQGRCRYPRSFWMKALWFSLVSTIGYYTFVVLALRYSTPAICALTLGVSPISIAFYGNWKSKETNMKNLIVPAVLILFGLGIVNIPQLQASVATGSYVYGLCCGFIALIAWTWYVVANSLFLKKHTEMGSGDWSTLIGVATLIWTLIFAIILGVFFGNQLQIQKYFTNDDQLIRFLAGCCSLGLLCSWVGAFLWNKASTYLPVSLAGQLTIFETIFGVIFVYALNGLLPPLVEILGILIFFLASAYGIQHALKSEREIAG